MFLEISVNDNTYKYTHDGRDKNEQPGVHFFFRFGIFFRIGYALCNRETGLKTKEMVDVVIPPELRAETVKRFVDGKNLKMVTIYLDNAGNEFDYINGRWVLVARSSPETNKEDNVWTLSDIDNKNNANNGFLPSLNDLFGRNDGPDWAKAPNGHPAADENGLFNMNDDMKKQYDDDKADLDSKSMDGGNEVLAVLWILMIVCTLFYIGYYGAAIATKVMSYRKTKTTKPVRVTA